LACHSSGRRRRFPCRSQCTTPCREAKAGTIVTRPVCKISPYQRMGPPQRRVCRGFPTVRIGKLLQCPWRLEMCNRSLQLAHGPAKADFGILAISPGPCGGGSGEANTRPHASPSPGPAGSGEANTLPAEQASPSPGPAVIGHERDVLSPLAIDKQLSSEMGIDGFHSEFQSPTASPCLEDNIAPVVTSPSRHEEALPGGAVW
jgi:hypothetical protein